MVSFVGPSAAGEQGQKLSPTVDLAEGFVGAARAGFRPNTYSSEVALLLSAPNGEFISSVRRAGAALPAEVLGTAIPLIAQLGTLITGTQRTVFALRLMIGACTDNDGKVSDGGGFEGTLQEIAERHVLKNLQSHSTYAVFQDLSVNPIPSDVEIRSASIPSYTGGYDFASIH